MTKLEALGKTANEAVLSDLSDTFEENEDGTASDEECETDDDDEHYEAVHPDRRPRQQKYN